MKLPHKSGIVCALTGAEEPRWGTAKKDSRDMGLGLENPVHLLIILAIVLMVFGAKRLPEMGRSLGEGMRGFKDAIGGETRPDAEISPTTVEEPQPGA
jgi:sec-independent protein translocase protein TatA